MKLVCAIFILMSFTAANAKECSPKVLRTAYEKLLIYTNQLSMEASEKTDFIFKPETKKLTGEKVREGYSSLMKNSKTGALIDDLLAFTKAHPECNLDPKMEKP